MTTKQNSNDIPFAFFGSSVFSVIVLDELKVKGFVPQVIVTAPDRRQGRGMKLTPPPTKIWAEQHAIPVLQPEKLDGEFIYGLKTADYGLFILASYGKIIPKAILDIPAHGTLNAHPSLLPAHRGPSPIESQILSDNPEVGTTIMLTDEKMDHGPLLAQRKLRVAEDKWPMGKIELEQILAHMSGELLAEILPKWIAGEIQAQEQNHSKVTYCKLIKKEDGLINLADNPRTNLLKIKAYEAWPRAYFFAERNDKKIRVIITDADIRDGVLVIKKVIPEGKKKMSYTGFSALPL